MCHVAFRLQMRAIKGLTNARLTRSRISGRARSRVVRPKIAQSKRRANMQSGRENVDAEGTVTCFDFVLAWIALC